ncbi:MAG: hypothetical protein GAK28_02805 [Luteibacter sp.]|uniref:hypothetical protein n=1 Tax=Luteibacter sp. TaxID=1886636 RepID=UPI001383DA8E|nr:hypothetical protein [Luteibacter sp.]KAF1006187.1 MAG: hypothetical protein GAK28_02805 [Luteibacter sp.]
MTTAPVLFVGGSGFVGRAAVRWFRARHPDRPILIGGRNLEAASNLAREVGHAEAIAIDLGRPGLGLDRDIPLAAMLMLAPDNGLHGMRYAQDHGAPYLNIGNGLVEIGPETMLYAHRAKAAPIVLASHWMAGAAVFLALEAAKRFDTVQSVRIGVVFDDQDPAGPAAMEDMQRLHEAAPATLTFQDGKRAWLSGDATQGQVEAIDGRVLAANAFDPLDVASLFAATGAPNVRFDLATAESSSRRRGGEVAAEFIAEIEGTSGGKTTRARSTLEFLRGQSSLTALAVVLDLEAIMGWNGRAPIAPGLYLPELLGDARWFLDELRTSGATIVEG